MVRVESTTWLRAIPPAGLRLPGLSAAQLAKGETAAGGVEIEEMTVTAQEREESLQEIPVAVTALSGGDLREKGVANVASLGEAVANLKIAVNPTTQYGTTISMRGVSQPNPNPAFQPTVGVYVDGVYLSNIQGSKFNIEDLERVEVLRGPQGTLFGRNTIGGAVNCISKKYRSFGIDLSPALGSSGDAYGPPRTFGLERA
ncbi:MAG: TonB-dependent receptor [Deltaproteobacteria bacterium]|nr:TonB-dependent receptor [Deltaproteobacteria bacterium]MBP1774719.1 TonB-dependent receptor [candidate division NC10 bacterium]